MDCLVVSSTPSIQPEILPTLYGMSVGDVNSVNSLQSAVSSVAILPDKSHAYTICISGVGIDSAMYHEVKQVIFIHVMLCIF